MFYIRYVHHSPPADILTPLLTNPKNVKPKRSSPKKSKLARNPHYPPPTLKLLATPLQLPFREYYGQTPQTMHGLKTSAVRNNSKVVLLPVYQPAWLYFFILVDYLLSNTLHIFGVDPYINHTFAIL